MESAAGPLNGASSLLDLIAVSTGLIPAAGAPLGLLLLESGAGMMMVCLEKRKVCSGERKKKLAWQGAVEFVELCLLLRESNAPPTGSSLGQELMVTGFNFDPDACPCFPSGPVSLPYLPRELSRRRWRSPLRVW